MWNELPVAFMIWTSSFMTLTFCFAIIHSNLRDSEKLRSVADVFNIFIGMCGLSMVVTIVVLASNIILLEVLKSIGGF